MLRPAPEAESGSQPPAKAPRLEAGSSSFGSFSTSSSSGGANPFSGLSLFSGPADGKSLFQSAAANISGSFLANNTASVSSQPNPGSFGAFAASTPSSGLGFASSSTPASTSTTTTAAASGTSVDTGATAASGVKANPFAGLSLFASAGKAAEPPGAPLFTAASGNFAKTDHANPAPQSSTTTFEEAKVIEQSETGEEDEEILFRSECRLWRLIKEGGEVSSQGSASQGWRWQERGSGIVHINQHRESRAGRLVMRMRGVLKSMLNSPIIPNSKYEKVGNKSIRFTGVDVDADPSQSVQGKPPLCDFRLTLQSGDQRAHMLRILTSNFKVGTREQSAATESTKPSSSSTTTTTSAPAAPPAAGGSGSGSEEEGSSQKRSSQ